MCVAALAGCASGNAQPGSAGDPAGIDTRGTGTVTGTPDTLTVALGVQTQAGEAAAALDANAQRSTALIDTLKGRGVPAEDIQTSGLSVNPTYESGSGRINGYQVTNRVTATLHDIATAGTLIDAAAAAAGDSIRVEQTVFSISDDSELRAEARARAVRQAQDQARQIADAAGVNLGAVRSIVEVPPTAPENPLMRSPMAFDHANTVPVEAGSQELAVTVQITYDIA
ncbi:SIMPL domain-containing protein [Prescottella defluvii]|uniref:SIMPL domain-containing protein n=1 Tax=Prescottella defluvii TaxID=1323361 RepID=UPI000AFA8BDE|nr:SIMPL domain-containing protein [Prescottella defluvii]